MPCPFLSTKAMNYEFLELTLWERKMLPLYPNDLLKGATGQGPRLLARSPWKALDLLLGLSEISWVRV